MFQPVTTWNSHSRPAMVCLPDQTEITCANSLLCLAWAVSLSVWSLPRIISKPTLEKKFTWFCNMHRQLALHVYVQNIVIFFSHITISLLCTCYAISPCYLLVIRYFQAADTNTPVKQLLSRIDGLTSKTRESCRRRRKRHRERSRITSQAVGPV